MTRAEAPTAGREVLDRTLEAARVQAYPPGEFVGQESFMQAGEVLALARRARIRPGVSVLDLCCGVAGPGRFLASRLGCAYLGVDADESAIEVARRRAAGLPCRFRLAGVPPVPAGPFDVVLLLETMLAFPDKRDLLRGVAAALAPGGRFAFTVEEGGPLTAAEQRAMPRPDTVWPVPWPGLESALEDVGLRVQWSTDLTSAHARTAAALAESFARHRGRIVSGLGPTAYDDLRAAHLLWAEWLGAGRVRKLAVVAARDPRTAG